MVATAVPAKRGVWKMLKLNNGTEVKAQLVGDEHGHYWRTDDGMAYMWNADEEAFRKVDAQAVAEKAAVRRNQVNAKRVKRMAKRWAGVAGSSYVGQKKGLILLVNFTDKKFKTSNDSALFQRIANEKNFSEGNFKGSMRDYFMAQSMGQFELDFDIVGPLTVSQKYSYYGKNDDKEGNDMRPAEMVIEAVTQAKSRVSDWAQYDWDGNGEVDQVYVVYAGYGEAEYGDENTIWPHAYDLESAAYYGEGTGPVTVARGLKVSTYACGSELNGSGKLSGIGTMCHEFSHCLGYPDFYDVDYSGGQGMCVWDLMDTGSYNDDGYLPAGYTSYERWVAGWAEPVVLEDEDVTVSDMAALQNGGKSYIIYNKRQRNEYFLLENRQLVGWDAALPASGLLILHVDYDADVWYANQPNDDPSRQRMTWIPADNKYQYQMYEGTKYYTEEGCMTDPFPYKSNNAFNKSTTPAAKLYNKNSDNSYYLTSSVEDITQNADSTMSFKFVASFGGGGEVVNPDSVTPSVEGALFYESFDQCNGKGGNDGSWSGQVANGEFLTDNTGWTAPKAYGAEKCAKFGTSSIAGVATTPAFQVTGTAKLSFKAGAWDAKNDGTTLNLSVTGATISPATVTIEKGSFTDCEATITGTGAVKVTFDAEKGRFFLDEVLVKDPATTGIDELKVRTAKAGRIYTLDGRFVGTDSSRLARGLYIVNGKKVLK